MSLTKIDQNQNQQQVENKDNNKNTNDDNSSINNSGGDQQQQQRESLLLRLSKLEKVNGSFIVPCVAYDPAQLVLRHVTDRLRKIAGNLGGVDARSNHLQQNQQNQHAARSEKSDSHSPPPPATANGAGVGGAAIR